MSQSDISKVLSSGSRWRILTSLSTGPKDIKSIVKEIAIQPTAVRYHIQSLIRLGLIDSYEEKGSVGRPKVFYRLAKKQVSVGFPPRDYSLLSEVFINGFLKLSNKRELKETLYKISSDFGRSAVEDLKIKYAIKKWTPVQFDKFFVGKFLPEFGSQSETVKLSGNEIVFRSHTCPFQELAIKYPEIICDIIHQGWFSGIEKANNNKLKSKINKSMGRKDQYCECSFIWID